VTSSTTQGNVSARSSNEAGSSIPGCFAVRKLTMRSNVVGCSTGVLRRRARPHTDADEQHEQHQLFRGCAHG
jgi:hypothetical protein